LPPTAPLLAARRPPRAFRPEDLLPAPAFPRILSRIAIATDQRRSILSAASRDALPSAWLEVRGLVVPPEGLRASLTLHRGPLASALRLGVLDVRPTRGARRCSRQLALTPRRVAQLAAAGEARILVALREPDGFVRRRFGLPCLALGLVFDHPLPPPPTYSLV
jgi:hypothetical protein